MRLTTLSSGSRSGFSLVELLIAVPPPGLLLAIAAPRVHEVSMVAALANTAEVANTPAGSGWTEDIDWSLGRSQKLDVSSATGDGTVTFSNPPATFHGIIKLVQGATPRTITWPAAKKWDDTDGEPTYAANKTYLIGVYYDGTSYFLGASHPYT